MKKILFFILLISSIETNAQFWSEKATGFNESATSLNSISIVDSNVIWANAYGITIPLDPNYTIKEFTRSIDGGNTCLPLPWKGIVY